MNRKPWMKLEVKYLIDNYQTFDNEDLKEIAYLINRTEKGVRQKLIELNCTYVKKRERIKEVEEPIIEPIIDESKTRYSGKSRVWEEEEKKYLIAAWGKKTIEEIASVLKRNVSAIEMKAYKLKLPSLVKIDKDIIIRDLLKAVGISRSTYNTIWKNNGFPAERKNEHNKKKFQFVNIENFWSWAYKNRDIINFANFEKNALGKEPNWVDEKRTADANNPSKKYPNRMWTKEDNELLVNMLNANKYYYSDLAKSLNRTEVAIKKRIRDLKLPMKPLPKKDRIYWTKEEEKQALELFKAGYNKFYIAKTLNKSDIGMIEKIKELYNRKYK